MKKDLDELSVPRSYSDDRCKPRLGYMVAVCYDYEKDFCPKTCDYALKRLSEKGEI